MPRIIRMFLHLFPTKLPQGMTAFEKFAKDIIQTYDVPDNPSVRFALAASVIHAKHDRAYVPRFYFGQIMLKGAANEIAGSIMRDLKEKQQAEATAKAQEAAVADVAQDQKTQS